MSSRPQALKDADVAVRILLREHEAALARGDASGHCALHGAAAVPCCSSWPEPGGEQRAYLSYILEASEDIP